MGIWPFRPSRADLDAARLLEAVQAASALAGEGWTTRLGSNPRGPGELFLAAAYSHVRARSSDAATAITRIAAITSSEEAVGIL